jgi:hypothetical protein
MRIYTSTQIEEASVGILELVKYVFTCDFLGGMRCGFVLLICRSEGVLRETIRDLEVL